MYPWFKTALILTKARFRPPLNIDDESVINLRAGITDIDPFLELNNARHLNMMELGRWDYAVRVGFFATMRSRKWAVVMGGASVRFRRRIPFWSRYTMHTRMICHDGRWLYFLQETKRQGEICSSALMKAGVSSAQGLVPAPEVLAAMGIGPWGEKIPDWVEAWIIAEGQRPWPTGQSPASSR